MALKFVESTKALRPASKDTNEALGDLPFGPFNFGLYFNKWMYVVGFEPSDGRKRGTPLACPISDETKQKDGKGDNITLCRPNMLLDNLDVSLALFNGLDGYSRVEHQEKNGKAQPVRTSYTLNAKWSRNTADALLKSKHAALNKSAEAYRLLGYEVMTCRARLLSSLVIGIGNEHPTGKGFHFDWNLGVPFIPATGLKGVVRLAYLVNRLNELDEAKAEAFWKRISNGLLDDDARELFGCSEDKKNSQHDQRGGIIFFDAYPEELPRLAPEIMNCHYPDYLNKQAERGPTEDQQPNPQKYWAISPWLDNDRKRPLHFIFRILFPAAIAIGENGEKLRIALEEALNTHGLGAKTAVGHGHFQLLKDNGSSHMGSPSGAASTDIIKDPGVKPSTPTVSLAAPRDPEAERQARVDSFKKSLPKSSDIPAQVDGLLLKIRAMEDEETRRRSCRVLLDHAQADKKKFKEAEKAGRAWARKLKDLCVELGLE